MTELKKQVFPRFRMPYVTLRVAGFSNVNSSAFLSDIC